MKKENIYIDLSKCSEEELKNIYTILGDTLKFIAPSIVFNFPIMHYHEGMWIRTNFYQDKAKEDSFLEDKTELTYPEFIKLFEGGDVENETSLQIAIKALKNISNPIEYMKSQLEEGDTLNGAYAVMLSGKPQFYQNIAEEALRKINSNLIKQK